jgi:hypothetical protein
MRFGHSPVITTYNTHRKRWFRRLFTLVTISSLAVPCVALGADRVSRNSGSASVSSQRRQQSFPHRFHDSRFFSDDFGGAEVIIEQQSQSAPTTEPDKPTKKRIYVQPHWVDGGYGVEVLKPGYWTDVEKQPRR